MSLPSQVEKRNSHAAIVPGVYVEVLWDVEQVKEDGRRSGERLVKSIWWRAEVVSIEDIHGRSKARLRYDGRDGFQEQIGDVWVFPRHVRLIDDESTQLRWRFYEGSGNVTYDVEDRADTFLQGSRYFSDLELHSSHVQALQEKVGTVLHHYESLERQVIEQNLLCTRLLESGSGGDRECSKLFSALREKIAVLMQKPIPSLKMRKENDVHSSFIDNNCAGCLTVDVDCDFNLFQAVARVVSSRKQTTCFRPCFADTQCPPANIDEAEIFFASFSDLAKAIGINATADLMHMTLRQRGSWKHREYSGADVAIRLLGTCLTDGDEEHSAMAILISKSIHEESLSNAVDAFMRDSREYNLTARAYRHCLKPRSCTREQIIRTVFNGKLQKEGASKHVFVIRGIAAELPNFAIRWRRLTSPNPRVWSRSLAVSQFDNGILEVEIPFLLFRGIDSVEELMGIVTESFIQEQLQNPKQSEEENVVSEAKS